SVRRSTLPDPAATSGRRGGSGQLAGRAGPGHDPCPGGGRDPELDRVPDRPGAEGLPAVPAPQRRPGGTKQLGGVPPARPHGGADGGGHSRLAGGLPSPGRRPEPPPPRPPPPGT